MLSASHGRRHSAEGAGLRGGVQGILVSGKPHLGTDRLVLLLRAFRRRLVELGVDLRFGATMADLLVQRGRVCGVRLRGANFQNKVCAFGSACLMQCLA